MDWYVNASDSPAVQELRREITAHMSRHAAPKADLDAAGLAVGELLGNLVKHAPGPAWVSLNWPGEIATLVVTDLGPGVVMPGTSEENLLAESGRGFAILDAVGDDLRAEARHGGGSRISVQIPLPRNPEDSHNWSPSPGRPLPDLGEARPEGGFGKESFLRALVVQLTQSVERISGPVQAQSVVSQVGVDVGGQMEAEYRAVHALTERMTTQQIADALVRLKQAIDGNFRIIELTEDRIVFTNTRCPFGDVVQRAPALCRMTSSVFGGIAARNSPDGSASILLEERIAVGDPHCRVVVYLGPAPEDVAPYAHRYQA